MKEGYFKPELGNRLGAVAGMVNKTDCLADIGCDHGLISIYLVQEGIAERMLACDINKGPLRGASENVRNSGLEDRIELRLGDGISPVSKGETSGGILAGMGGPLGLRILYEGREIVRDWLQAVLSLQSKLPLVRFVLQTWGFETEEEKMVTEDGKFYSVMRLAPPKDGIFYEEEIENIEEYLKTQEGELKHLPADELCEYTYGSFLFKTRSAALVAFLEKEEERLLGIMERLERENAAERQKEIVDEIDLLMLAKWKLKGEA